VSAKNDKRKLGLKVRGLGRNDGLLRNAS
jgi:hypothetical protein